ncbi:MAG: hypothetical protein ACRDV9_03350 [Acidimicrobiia bacterium]
MITREVSVRRRLDADHHAGRFFHATDVRLENVEVGVAVVMPGVEIDVRDAGLRSCGRDDLDDFLDRFFVSVVRPEV